MLNLPFKTLLEATKAIATQFPDLLNRSYAINRSVSSMLWLCKERQKGPTYSQGKLLLSEPKRFSFGEDTIFCGYYVERGMKESTKSNEKLQPHWQWNRFIADLDTRIGAAIARSVAIVGEPLYVVLLSSFNNVSESLSFTTSGTTLTSRKHEAAAGALAGAATANNLTELKHQLSSLPSSTDWHWIDFHIGLPCTLNDAGPDDLATCVRMLECFEPWVGSF